MHSPTRSSGAFPRPATRRRVPGRVGTLIVPVALLALVALPAIAQAAGHDSDGDGLSNHYERTVSHTNPHRDDTDSDGLRDGYEIRRSKTNPLKSDTDGDGLTDRQELFPVGYLMSAKVALSAGTFTVKTPKTDPRRRDTDGDGLSDGYEVRTSFTSPIMRDTDSDGLGDGVEVLTTHTNPLSGDTDGDGIGDWEEVQAGSNPLDPTSRPSSTTPLLADTTAPTPLLADTTVPDTTAPDTSITSGPSGTVTSNAASFSVSSTETGSTFECRLDSGAWSACLSPKAYSNLADGSHTFDVRATDRPATPTPRPPRARGRSTRPCRTQPRRTPRSPAARAGP